MRVHSALALIALLSLAALAVSNPVSDLSKTSISVSEEPATSATPTSNANPEQLKVTVERVDELVSDDGDLIAARVVDVVFKFDVDNEKLLLNGVPVPLGISSVKIDSALIANREVTVVPMDTLAEQFDQGIATVQVGAQAEALLLARADLVADPSTIPGCHVEDLPELIEVRRIKVNARVIEVNGQKVVQTELVEQILDVFLGFVAKSHPKKIPYAMGMAGMSAPDATEPGRLVSDGHRANCLHHRRLSALWHRLPHHTRVAVAAFLGSLIILVFFVALPLAVYVQWKERRLAYQRLQAEEPLCGEDDEDDEEYDEHGLRKQQVVVEVAGSADEKAALKANNEH
jgi:transposase